MNKFLIAGLGNPGSQYYDTRHNLGALFVEKLSGFSLQDYKHSHQFNCLSAKKDIAGTQVHYVLPWNYMNNSGHCLFLYAQYFKIPVENILVCYDDLSLPCGDFRLKTHGGHGGHNGMRNCLEHFSAKDLVRLRLGIDHPGQKDQVHHYVLKAFSCEQMTIVEQMIEKLCENSNLIYQQQWSKFQNTLH